MLKHNSHPVTTTMRRDGRLFCKTVVDLAEVQEGGGVNRDMQNTGGRKPVIAPACFLQIRNFLKVHWEPRAGIGPSPETVAPGEWRLRLWRNSCTAAFISRWNETASKFGIIDTNHQSEQNQPNLQTLVCRKNEDQHFWSIHKGWPQCFALHNREIKTIVLM